MNQSPASSATYILTLKRSLRSHIRDLKKALSPEARRLSAYLVEQAVLTDTIAMSCQVFIAFWSMPDEVDTSHLLDTLISRGKNVYLPVMVGNILEFRRYTGVDCLKPEGLYNILEPQNTEILPLSDGSHTCIIVPGMAFTTAGLRLGRGRGFYDRALKSMPAAYTVGIGFACQLVDDIPVDSFDVPLNAVYCC